MNKELLQVVNEHDNSPFCIMPRHEVISQGMWCRSTSIFVMNSKGQILCHKRSIGKERLPGVWSTHLGGHVTHDETYEENAIKELYEESGIELPIGKFLPWRVTKLNKARLWIKEFVVYWDADKSSLIPQPGEVDEFAWKYLEEVIEEEKRAPQIWCAGTHDIKLEYACMRAALTLAHMNGIIQIPDSMHTW